MGTRCTLPGYTSAVPTVSMHAATSAVQLQSTGPPAMRGRHGLVQTPDSGYRPRQSSGLDLDSTSVSSQSNPDIQPRVTP